MPVALALLMAQYKIESTPRIYETQMVFDGFLPLLGGNTGKTDVFLKVKTQGQTSKGDQKASLELTDFKLSFEGMELPLDISDAKEYFPNTVVTFTPAGKVTHSTAPDKELPIKLPGLDIKRFPDLTFLPVEFPSQAIEAGSEWDFTRSYGGSDVKYRCTVSKVDGSLITVNLTFSQEFTVFENEALEIVTKKEDAVSSVTTNMQGTGTILFDLKLGAATSTTLTSESISKVKDLAGKLPDKTRNLKSSVKIKLIEQKQVSASRQTSQPSLWERAVRTAGKYASKAKDSLAIFWWMLGKWIGRTESEFPL